MAEPRTIAGLSCFDVLAELSDFVDGTLPADRRAQVEAHLAQCDACTRFGAEFSAVVTAARALVRPPDR